MAPMRVYVETSVWSFAFADDSPQMTEHTLAFFEQCRRGKIAPIVSPLVARELQRADEPVRGRLMALLTELSPEVIPASEAIDALAEEFVRLGAVPPSKPDDAAHVAAAFVDGVEVLVSWNYKHIANVRRSQKFNAAAALRGYVRPLTITTPAEVAYAE